MYTAYLEYVFDAVVVVAGSEWYSSRNAQAKVLLTYGQRLAICLDWGLIISID
jgi:hypothetical protein